MQPSAASPTHRSRQLLVSLPCENASSDSRNRAGLTKRAGRATLACQRALNPWGTDGLPGRYYDENDNPCRTYKGVARSAGGFSEASEILGRAAHQSFSWVKR